MAIHATALIDPKAQLDSTVEVGAYSIIGPNVSIGSGRTGQSGSNEADPSRDTK